MRIRHLVSCIDSPTPTGATIIADEGEHLLGTLTMSLEDPAGFVRSLYVEPEARGRGVGSALLAYAVDVAKTLGRTGLGLSVKDTNTSARSLYERLQFVPHAVEYEGYTKYIRLFCHEPA